MICDSSSADSNKEKFIFFYRQTATASSIFFTIDIVLEFVNSVDSLADIDYLYGLRYESGVGVVKDDVRAFKMYSQAASKGHADAMSRAAVCLYEGRGVSKDRAKAAELFAQLADQGYIDAAAWQRTWSRPLSYTPRPRTRDTWTLCYEHGHGVEKDAQKAARLFGCSRVV